MDLILSGSLGALVAFLFAIPAIVLEVKAGEGPSDAPLIVDVRRIFGQQLKRREAFLVGLLLHIIFGFLFGLIYVVFVSQGWLFITHAPYTFVSFILYALLSWIIAGFIIYPALGMGFFARREGKSVWLETIVSHLLLGIALWLIVQYYQPVFFLIPT